MIDQEPNSEEQEVAPLDTDNNDSQQDAVTSDAQDLAKSEAKDRDWRAMRQRQKELEWQLKQKDEVLNRFLSQQQPQAPQLIEEPEIPDEEYVPVKGVKGIAKKTIQPLEKKIQDLEQKLAQQEQQKRLSSLKATYPDFDDVVNVETLEIFEKMKPGLAATISKLDPYDMGIQTYEFIKSLGIVDQLPDSRRAKEVSKKIEKNAKAVQSPTAYDKRPMAQAYKSTQADKTKLYEEMMHYASQANGF